MNCKECDVLLDSIREGRLSDSQRAAIDAHLASCEACRFKHWVLTDCLSLDDDAAVPDSLSNAWRQHITDEEGQQKVKQLPRLTRAVAIAAALLVLVGGTWLAGRERRQGAQPAPMAGYGNQASFGKQSAAGDMALGAAPAAEYMQEAPADSATLSRGMGGEAESNAKIIRTARIELSTRQFDADYDAILAQLAALGGRVQNTGLYNSQGSLRVLYLTLRIPAAKLDQAIASFKGVGRLVSFNESAEDISERYTDTENRLKTQLAKMERLQALLAKAESVEDLVTIESGITDTQFMIDQLTGSLQGMESRVQEATLDLTLNELSAIETAQDQEETLPGRILNGMRAAFEGFRLILSDLLVFLAVALPYLLALAVLVILIRFLIRRRKNP